MMELRIQCSAAARRGVDPGLLGVLARRIRAAARRMTLEHRSLRITVQIVDDTAMAALHQRHMGELRTTDVLAFPEDDAGNGNGDIALNWDACRRQARGSDTDAQLEEATSLCVHALAHLFGHDHGARRQARRMYRVERRLLRPWIWAPERPYGGHAGG